MIHIGNKIREVFIAHPKNHTIVWFANQLHCQRANIYKIFNRQTVDTMLLYQISQILNHNFFADLSADYAKNNQ